MEFIIADNQAVTRAGMHSFINEIVEEARIVDVYRKSELLAALIAAESAVVIIDYTLFDINGLDDLLIMQKRFPRVEWLLFSSELSEGFLRRVGVEGNIGLLMKECGADEIEAAVRGAVIKRPYICRQARAVLSAPVPSKAAPTTARLTPAEEEILRLVALGKSVKEIAAARCLSVHTVITHKKNIFRKLEVNSVFEATRHAIKAGLVELVEYYI